MKLHQAQARVVVLLLMIVLLAACSMFSTNYKTIDQDSSPTSLTFGVLGQIPESFKERVTAHFPHITFQFVPLTIGSIEKLYENGQVPDIILDVDRLSIPPRFMDVIQYDLTSLIKQYKMDLSNFEQGLIEHVRSYGERNQLYALPYSRYTYALFYNKTVFDRLHIAYPKNGMSWDEVFELAKALSTTKDGVTYRGFEPITSESGFIALMDQHSLHFVEPPTDKADVHADGWRSLLTLIKRFYELPGNSPGSQRTDSVGAFAKEGRVAMTLGASNELAWLQLGADNGYDLDVVTFPTIVKGSGTGPGSRTQNLSISATSAHKDKAFQVIAYLVSSEFQKDNMQNGMVTVLRDPKIAAEFGTSLRVGQDKNLRAFIGQKLPNVSPISKYETSAFMAAGSWIRGLTAINEDVAEQLTRLGRLIDAAVDAEKSKRIPEEVKAGTPSK